MSRLDFTTPRLFVRPRLVAGGVIDLDRNQANYLLNVLRMRDGDPILLFNGRDGEWRASVSERGRKAGSSFLIAEPTRLQTPAADLDYLFAPLKHARLDYLVQKAVEMGVGRLRPILTQHTQITRLNRERMEANAIEAAEQCGILTIPRVDDPIDLKTMLDSWEAVEGRRRIVFCDEGEEMADPLDVLRALPEGPLAVLLGPEGGFSVAERAVLRAKPFVTSISLGPRILRADTAAVAAIALLQATRGDWRAAPAPPAIVPADPAAAPSDPTGSVPPPM